MHLSTQGIYSQSNFYINLSKYLNQNFFSYNTLLAENFVMVRKLSKSEKNLFFLKNLENIIVGIHQNK